MEKPSVVVTDVTANGVRLYSKIYKKLIISTIQ